MHLCCPFLEGTGEKRLEENGFFIGFGGLYNRQSFPFKYLSHLQMLAGFSKA
jgi:hypothetical protein